MKPLKLKDILNEIVSGKGHSHTGRSVLRGADYVDSMLQDLSPAQLQDVGELNSLLHRYFGVVKKERGDMRSAIRDAQEAFAWNDLDSGLVYDYLQDEAGASINPNDSDQY